MNLPQDLKGLAGIPFPSRGLRDQNFDGSQIPSSKKSRVEDVKTVKNLIEQCMKLYMSKHEVMKFLSEKIGIEPGVTVLVWQKLEEENADFFQVYYTRLRLKKQILSFNDLLEKQCNLMNFQNRKSASMAPTLSGSHQMHGYAVLQQRAIPSTVQVPSGYTGDMSDRHAVNGFSEVNNIIHPLQMFGNDFGPCSSMAMERLVSPAGQFHFTSPDISGQGIHNPVVDPTFVSLEPDVGTGMHYFQAFSPMALDSSFLDPNPDSELFSTFEGTPEFFVDAVPDLGSQKEGDDSQSQTNTDKHNV